MKNSKFINQILTVILEFLKKPQSWSWQKLLVQLVTTVRDFLKPPKAFSWQTIILVSIVVGLFAIALAPLAIVAFLLFAFGVGWFTRENPIEILGIPVGAWITGALASIAILVISGDLSLLPVAFVAWPIISALIGLLPELLDDGLRIKNPSPEVRLKLLTFVFVHLLISCWVLFYFVIQNWLQQYPSLAADNLSRSAFVVRIHPPASPPASRGSLVLSSVESNLKNQIDNKVWPDVERWLLDGNQRVRTLSQQALAQLPQAEENRFWQFGSTISSIQSGYKLDLLANWRGPSSTIQGYHLKKTCNVTLSRSRGAAAGSPVSRSDLKCTPVSQPIAGLVNLSSAPKTNK